jgi:hypothetical protein
LESSLSWDHDYSEMAGALGTALQGDLDTPIIVRLQIERAT